MRVLLVDDHPLMLAALESVVQGLGSDITVVCATSAGSARQALETDAAFDLALLDVNLGDANGFVLLVELRAQYPSVPVVVISGSHRPADVVRAIDLGAMGFVPKSMPIDKLLDALRRVMSGAIYVPSTNADAEPLPPSDGDTVPSVMRREPAPASLDRLGFTQRQIDVLGHMLQGKTNKMIAKEMELSTETVKGHVTSVLRLLGVESRTQAVLAVSRMQQGSKVTQ